MARTRASRPRGGRLRHRVFGRRRTSGDALAWPLASGAHLIVEQAFPDAIARMGALVDQLPQEGREEGTYVRSPTRADLLPVRTLTWADTRRHGAYGVRTGCVRGAYGVRHPVRSRQRTHARVRPMQTAVTHVSRTTETRRKPTPATVGEESGGDESSRPRTRRRGSRPVSVETAPPGEESGGDDSSPPRDAATIPRASARRWSRQPRGKKAVVRTPRDHVRRSLLVVAGVTRSE